MKKAIFLILFTLPIALCYAQNQTELWGMTYFGGDGDGIIFKTDGNGDNQQVVETFIDNPGKLPYYTNLCQADNGKLYGMTTQGGTTNYGVIFEYDPITTIYTKKFDFDGITNGCNPYGSLVQASNGKLYGLTSLGGTNNMGVLFEYDPATSTFTKKMDFTGASDGSIPVGSLILAANGKLYGLTSQGGANNMGVLFEYDPATSTYAKKLDFAGATNGRNPNGSLIQASNGKLYGMTKEGGTNDLGVLFEFDPATTAYLKKLDFAGATNGSLPLGTLMQASNGKLYGMTKEGGASNLGVLFEYNLATSTYSKKLDFAGASNGSNPTNSLIQSDNGKLYGLVAQGGANSLGVLFEYDPSTSTYIKKLDFANDSNGKYPMGALMQASNGKLYGMTYQGGVSNMGVLFEYEAGASTVDKKIDFADASDGSMPLGSLMLASNGKFYGMTLTGGVNSLGVIFEYNPMDSTYSKLFDFAGTSSGSYPKGSLIQTSDGKFYGMTLRGGTNDFGVIFEYDLSTSTFTKKVDFTGTANGSSPYGSLMQAANGKLYGMTYDGGTNSKGVLFEYDPGSSTYTKKVDFAGISNGSFPYGSLAEADNGKLYGMTFQGGANNWGVFFEFDPSTSTYTKLLDFAGMSNGRYPKGSLIEATNGRMYGIVTEGGAFSSGVIIEYDPLTSSFTNIHDFAGTTYGRCSEGSLIQAENGKFYGMTEAGGTSDFGVLFEYDLITSTYTKKLDFTGANGKSPIYTNLVEICSQPKFLTSMTDISICQNSDTCFVVSASGNGITYQWQVDEGSGFVNLSNNSVYSDVLNDTLRLNGVLSNMNNFSYRCIVSSTCPIRSIESDTAILTIYPSHEYTENQSICEGEVFYWQGADYSSSDTYVASYTNEYGCDSIYTLNLTVNIPAVGSITGLEPNYCLSSPVVEITGLPLGGIFTGPGVLGNEFSPSAAGIGTWEITYSFTDANNCENSTSLIVDVYDCSDIETEKLGNIQVYPNPNNGDLYISLVESGEFNFKLVNTIGQVIWSKNGNFGTVSKLSVTGLDPGVYYLQITNTEMSGFVKIIVR